MHSVFLQMRGGRFGWISKIRKVSELGKLWPTSSALKRPSECQSNCSTRSQVTDGHWRQRRDVVERWMHVIFEIIWRNFSKLTLAHTIVPDRAALVRSGIADNLCNRPVQISLLLARVKTSALRSRATCGFQLSFSGQRRAGFGGLNHMPLSPWS